MNTKKPRGYSLLDHCIMQVDQTLKTLWAPPITTDRPCPSHAHAEVTLSKQEQRHVTGLMRINHAGEMAAQGLYQGQALTAQLPDVRQQMQQAAEEEYDHLAWCEQRLTELGSHTSLLNPIWYGGALLIGATAGIAGDKWSLGFVAETERQVTAHLDAHLEQLPAHDNKSRAILTQMREDEAQHATTATQAGATMLPDAIKTVMRFTARLMTKSAYWI